jgi:hypothetical protein
VTVNVTIATGKSVSGITIRSSPVRNGLRRPASRLAAEAE